MAKSKECWTMLNWWQSSIGDWLKWAFQVLFSCPQLPSAAGCPCHREVESGGGQGSGETWNCSAAWHHLQWPRVGPYPQPCWISHCMLHMKWREMMLQWFSFIFLKATLVVVFGGRLWWSPLVCRFLLSFRATHFPTATCLRHKDDPMDIEFLAWQIGSPNDS